MTGKQKSKKINTPFKIFLTNMCHELDRKYNLKIYLISQLVAKRIPVLAY